MIISKIQKLAQLDHISYRKPSNVWKCLVTLDGEGEKTEEKGMVFPNVIKYIIYVQSKNKWLKTGKWF